MIFNKISAAFNQFQSHFTYRQKFVFMAILFLIAIPTPTYWNLKFAAFMEKSAALQDIGMRYEKLLTQILYEVSEHGILTSEKNLNDKKIAQIETKMDILLEQIIEFNKGVEEVHTGDLLRGNLIEKTAQPLIDPIKHSWYNILNAKQKISSVENYEQHLTLVKNIAEQLRQLEYTFDLTVTRDPALFQLMCALLEIYPRVSVLVADLTMRELLFGDTIDENAPVLIAELKKTVIELNNELESAYQSYLKNSSQSNFQLYNKSIVQKSESLKGFKILYDLFQMQAKNGNAILNVTSTAQKLLKDLKESERIDEEMAGSLIQTGISFNFFLKICVYILIGISSIGVIFYLVFHVLSGHLLKLLSYIELISSGKFSNRLTINSKDTVGQIGLAFISMGNAIDRVVSQLQEVGEQLKEFSIRIGIMTDDQENTVVTQEFNLRALENVATDIARKSRDLANTMNALIISSRETLVESGTEYGLNEMQENMTSLAETSTMIVSTLSKVNDKVSKARKLIGFMTRVSDQAHLLSLNAAIETLSIGKQYPEFAEITMQIQRFAEMTATSTSKINQIVSAMFTRVSLGRDTTKNSIKEINAGANRLIQVSHQLSSITKEGEKQTEKFGQVNRDMHVQAQDAENIIKTIEGLTNTARQNTISIRELRQTIEALAKTTQELHNVLDLFFSHDENKKMGFNEAATLS